uniref:NHS-like protein 2 isoform X1 n=1 Tax=Oncorhynchus gorbuscha TaxID=8017 RepID=UPI001EAF3F2B|nr:NHS-like protein 2 isoform X1 [Oncorhynchus gorbuscha]
MPFYKRTLVPKDVCRNDTKRPNANFGDLVDVCGFSLCSVLRQLSDLSRQSVSILEELEGELVSVCLRSETLEGKVISLQRHITALSKKPPPKTTTILDAEPKRSAASSSTAAAHFRSPWQQSVNVFGSWSRPDCVQELHQEAQLNLQSLLQDFEEQLYDTKLTGQTFRHPTVSSQTSGDTTTLSRSPISLNNKRPEFLFLPASKRQVCEEDETSSVGINRGVDPSPSPSPCGSDRPLVVWSSTSLGPPVAEKPRWHLGQRTPAHLLPPDVTGEGKVLDVDLLQGSCSPSLSLGCGITDQPRSLEPVSDTPVQHLTLRKTHSDLDLSLSLPQSPWTPPPTLGTMDHSATLLCSNSPSQSWNGPKGSTFSPGVWSEAYSYNLAPNPLGKGPATMPKTVGMVGGVGGQGGGLMCPSQTSLGLSGSSGSQSHSSSFTSISESSCLRHPVTMVMMMGRRSETEGAAASPAGGQMGSERGVGEGERRERSAHSIAAANAFKFRERSLSTPTDSGSFCSTDNVSGGMYSVTGVTGAGNGTNGGVPTEMHSHHHYQPRGERGESYALLYPSGSSEDGSASVDNISITDGNFPQDGRLRLRSRSISLKKSKHKPPPPIRSVSLMKNLGDADGHVHGRDRGHYREGRPKSLHIPREHLQDFQPNFLLPSSSCLSKPDLEDPELGYGGMDGPPGLEVQGPNNTELSSPAHWQLGEWKSSDPYQSWSGSSTATGTTVIDCMKVRGSSESLLDSPSTSRASSPSLLSIESTKASSPFKPPGLMSPSSGYSSQSETPTPITPSNQVTGTTTGPASTFGCKMRPKIPERKSSLPVTSPRDPAARSRLSFEMPVNAHLDLSSIKPKQKASRRHSDTSTAAKPGKLSSGSQSSLPVVTTNELRTIRLRSVSRTDLEDFPDGASDDIIEEEQGLDLSPPGVNSLGPLVASKPKPPVAVKPPLPKRPFNLLLKCPSSSPVDSESSPASPNDPPRPMPNPSIYMVVGRKPKLKKALPHTPTSPCGPLDQTQTFHLHHPQGLYNLPSFPHIQSLYDLPPLPLPQPLLEDPTLEPEFDPDSELHIGLEGGWSLPSPCSNLEVMETQDKSRTLPSRMTISCLAELDKKKPKVPPPVPKKPNSLLLPSNSTTVHSKGSTDRQGTQMDGPAALRSPVGASPPEEIPGKEENQENHLGTDEESSMESSLHSSLQDCSLTDLEGRMATVEIGTGDDSVEENVEHSSLDFSGKTDLHITEETDDDVGGHTPSTHNMEDLFTKIHRSKRKVLGRKEPGDSFGSRQSLVSPVKHSTSGGDLQTLTLGSTLRSSSRNDNFMALLQKKGSKSSRGGTRLSAMELLKSTNPLARRITEFSTSSDGGGDTTTGKNRTRPPQDQ